MALRTRMGPPKNLEIPQKDWGQDPRDRKIREKIGHQKSRENILLKVKKIVYNTIPGKKKKEGDGGVKAGTGMGRSEEESG